MSGLVKGIKKVFKKAVKFVKKYWKWIVIAVAVYFTAGVALSYFGSTAGFASSMMPGFGVNGIFSKAAVWMGFNGSASVASGLSMTSGAWAGHVGAAFGTKLTAAELAAIKSGASVGAMTSTGAHVVVPAGTVSGEVAGAGEIINVAAGTAAPATADAATKAGLATAGGSTAGNAAGGAAAGSGVDAATKAMSGAMKLQAASTILQTAAGLAKPEETDQPRQAFGVNRKGESTWGWGTGQTTLPQGANQMASMYAPQQQYSSQGGGGSMYAPQQGGGDFIAAAPPPQGAPQQGGGSYDLMGGGQAFIPPGGNVG